ncbi:MAG: imidazoleglycerol-phosphate dehydratase HisB [Clostridia bacterium]|nr:imidazoleglycerol-phosphate dehydratase HisB [Clostridia bacterium]
MRTSEIVRKTAETDITLQLNLDGVGNAQINSGCGFLDHMLTLFAKHGRFDLTLTCVGDTFVDDHHTVEDIGIALGQAFAVALGNKKGVVRYGDTVLPMDESLILSAVDLSGRDYLGYDLQIPTEKVGSFDTELAEEFWLAFTRNAACTLHIRQLAGKNAHHILEGSFKSVARSLRKAVAIDEAFADEIPSTKGVL